MASPIVIDVSVRVGEPPCAQRIELYRGADYDFALHLYDANGVEIDIEEAEITLAWNKRGMTGWWTDDQTPLEWHPSNDTGASNYIAFWRIEIEGAVVYHVNAVLAMIDSPGAVINQLPLPTPVIDFDEVQALNAPWVLKADVAQLASTCLAMPMQTDREVKAVIVALLNGLGEL